MRIPTLTPIGTVTVGSTVTVVAMFVVAVGLAAF
jgi:hypothetical protein